MVLLIEFTEEVAYSTSTFIEEYLEEHETMVIGTKRGKACD
jgi:hypothetical protein